MSSLNNLHDTTNPYLGFFHKGCKFGSCPKWQLRHNHVFLKDKLLLQQVAKGDEQAYKMLYDRYWEVLYRVAYCKVGSAEVAKELVQDLFVDLWFKRENLSNIKEARLYLIGALKYAVLDYIRKQTVRDKYVKEVMNTVLRNDFDCFENVSFNETQHIIFEQIEQLPLQCKKVFKLSRFEHLSVKDIAIRLELSPKTVENHIGRALRILKTGLKEQRAHLEVFILLFMW